ncbi:MAG TPA: ABC transporter ATP-binding protein [Clostridia bacterium]|nr:ABC transporter ATP-binding protein [Clostridia bacterium]
MEIQTEARHLFFKSPKADKSNRHKGIWKAYFRLLYKAKLPYFLIAAGTALSFISVRIALKFPQYTQRLMAGELSNEVIFGMIFIAFARTFIAIPSLFADMAAQAKIDMNLRKLIWKSLINMPLPFFDKTKAREMVSRTTSDTASVSSFLMTTLLNQVTSLYSIVMTIMIVNEYDRRLALSFFILIPLVVFVAFIQGRLNFSAQSEVTKSNSKLTQFLAELLSNIPLIKGFANEEKEDARGKEVIGKLYKSQIKAATINVIFRPITAIVESLETLVIVGFGVYYVSKGVFGIDIWIAYYLYAGDLKLRINSIVSIFSSFKSSQGATERVSRLLEEPGEEYRKYLAECETKEDIVFENVSFGYNDKTVLSDISFRVPAGKITAIVGPSGSGKTTILSLVERFYKPDAGVIKQGDVPIEDMNLEDWRKKFGYVAQEMSLISGSIRDNILYGVDREVSEEEFQRAVAAADVMDFVKEFPEGFDTEVGEFGSKLSGGQRQRIAISRAILRNPDHLLLDEATSSLDASSEHIVQKNLDELMKNRTTIVIAHKIATVVNADQIIVVDSGKIAGIGTHEELLKTNEVYKEFFTIQNQRQFACPN